MHWNNVMITIEENHWKESTNNLQDIINLGHHIVKNDEFATLICKKCNFKILVILHDQCRFMPYDYIDSFPTCEEYIMEEVLK